MIFRGRGNPGSYKNRCFSSRGEAEELSNQGKARLLQKRSFSPPVRHSAQECDSLETQRKAEKDFMPGWGAVTTKAMFFTYKENEVTEKGEIQG